MQRVLILLAMPKPHAHAPGTYPTAKHMQNGMELYLHRSVSARQLRRLLAGLEAEGIVEKITIALPPGRRKRRHHALNYKIIDFDKAFQNVIEQKDQARKYKRRKKRLKRTPRR